MKETKNKQNKQKTTTSLPKWEILKHKLGFSYLVCLIHLLALSLVRWW